MTPKELKALRLEKKMTQQEMAEMLGVSVRTLIYWEKGEREIPAHVQKFAQSALQNDGQSEEQSELFKKFSFDYVIDKIVSERISGMEEKLSQIMERISLLDQQIEKTAAAGEKLKTKTKKELKELHESIYSLLIKTNRIEKDIVRSAPDQDLRSNG